MTTVFADHAPVYADAGLPTFPVDTRAKKPRVKRWQSATLRHSRAWARIPALGAADGLGMLMGKPSGIVEIDVDAVGTAWVGAALDRFGDTPVVIQTASQKHKLWYQHNGEGRHICPIPEWPIDTLGDGFSICPPSERDDLGTAYKFLHGSLADIGRLPKIRPGALETRSTRAAEGVQPGMRNDSVWRWCMATSRHCDDVETLIDAALTWALRMPDPLSTAEIEKCARSAMRYEVTGRNFIGKRKPQFDEGARIMDHLFDNPDAYMLRAMFERFHGHRPDFFIAPRAMSAAGSPPWHFTRIEKARDLLIERGFLKEIEPPGQGRNPGRYRLVGETSDSVHNNLTPFPLPTSQTNHAERG